MQKSDASENPQISPPTLKISALQLPEELQLPRGPLDGGDDSSWASPERSWGSGGDAMIGNGAAGDGVIGGAGGGRQRGFAAALVLNKVDLVEQEAWLDRVTRTLTTVAGGRLHF